MLHLKGVTKSFGGIMAVNDVGFELNAPGITGLVGPNGSGKTTLFHLITGFYSLDKGDIYFQGQRINGIAPHRISQMGLVRTFQQTRILPFMSVMESLLSASPNQAGERLTAVFLKPRTVRRAERANTEKAKEVLDLIRLTDLADQLASKLSFGQQKLLELGRVLMSKPKMILLDEPTAGINPTLIRRLVELLKTLNREEIQIFLIEHNMPLVAEVCRRLLVMDSGSLIFSGTPAEAIKNPRVIEAYLGKAHHDT
ncbi:MAG: ABC transporter ATP-binding protein [Desulfatiglandaceae bacterium]